MKKITILISAIALCLIVSAGAAQAALIDTWFTIGDWDGFVGDTDYSDFWMRGDSTDVSYLEYHGFNGPNDPGWIVGDTFVLSNNKYWRDPSNFMYNGVGATWDAWDGTLMLVFFSDAPSIYYTATEHSTDPIPEPASMFMFGLAGAGMVVKRFRRR